jgi:hypothetical protein
VGTGCITLAAGLAGFETLLEPDYRQR